MCVRHNSQIQMCVRHNLDMQEKMFTKENNMYVIRIILMYKLIVYY